MYWGHSLAFLGAFIAIGFIVGYVMYALVASIDSLYYTYMDIETPSDQQKKTFEDGLRAIYGLRSDMNMWCVVILVFIVLFLVVNYIMHWYKF